MKHKNILLVEDDYLDVKGIQRLFKRHNINHTLTVAHNGVDALAMLTGTDTAAGVVKPDIILLDINMPKMNGLEFLSIVKNYYTLSNIKVFVLTTSAEEYDRISAEKFGVTGYIVKPLEFPAHPGKQPGDATAMLERLLKE